MIEVITFTDDDQEWHVVGTHDVPAAIEAIHSEHGDVFTPADFELAEFKWGRWVECDHPDSAFALEPCSQDHPAALRWISGI